MIYNFFSICLLCPNEKLKNKHDNVIEFLPIHNVCLLTKSIDVYCILTDN